MPIADDEIVSPCLEALVSIGTRIRDVHCRTVACQSFLYELGDLPFVVHDDDGFSREPPY